MMIIIKESSRSLRLLLVMYSLSTSSVASLFVLCTNKFEQKNGIIKVGAAALSKTRSSPGNVFGLEKGKFVLSKSFFSGKEVYDPLRFTNRGGALGLHDGSGDDTYKDPESDETPPSPPPSSVKFASNTKLSEAIVEDEKVSIDTSSKTPSANLAASSPPSLLGKNAHRPPGFLRSRFPNAPWHKVPDMLTYLRCLAVPIFVALFYLPSDHHHRGSIYTGTIFAIASFTDWLDGYLARRWDISTAFGAFLDPVADKLMVSTSLILLSGRYGPITAIPSAIILAREIAVSALREWMATRGERNVVKVGIQGKIKTALTMVSLTVLLFAPASSTSTALFKVGIPLLHVSAFITITSGSVYFIAAIPALMVNNNTATKSE